MKISDLNAIRSKLPTNHVSLIAMRTGVSETTIYKYYRGENVRDYLAAQIYDESLNIIEEQNKTHAEREKRKARVLKGKY